MSDEEITRDKIRELREYAADSDRPSEITLANVGTVKIKIPRRQRRAIAWAMVVAILCGAAYLAALAVKTLGILRR